jgi:hypothetical protein
MTTLNVPLIIRGEVIDTAEVEHGGRGGGTIFTSPDVAAHVHRLGLTAPSRLSDLYALNFNEILDYLEDLGSRLSLDCNPWMEEAFRLSCKTSGLGETILRDMYANMGHALNRGSLTEVADRAVGLGYLNGWVETQLAGGMTASIRAFGSRGVHIIAGNAPGVAILTIARNAITRGDVIIKTPSNDPLTAAAIARTMIDMAPDHPLTRHVSVAYWKGGDEAIESALYRPSNIEKIVAWGGMASIKHIARYIGPGVELVALDPKLSSTIIGDEAFASEESMREVAAALAMDAGGLNQEGCVNARVVYVRSGTDEAGLDRLNRLGAMVFEAIQALPATISGPAERLDPALQDEIEALTLSGDDYYKVIGGTGPLGAIIVSQIDEPVDFSAILANRVVNLVPIDDFEQAVRAVNSYTQTIGIYPEALKPVIRDRLALHGAQRLVSLGSAIGMANHGIQDAIEPVRRMCRWIVDERASPHG